MDSDFVEQLLCADCGLVYGEMLARDDRNDDRICPRCGAGHGAISSVECVYATAHASLVRL